MQIDIKKLEKGTSEFLNDVSDYFKSTHGIILKKRMDHRRRPILHGQGEVEEFIVILEKKRMWPFKPILYVSIVATPESPNIVVLGNKHFEREIEQIFNKWKGKIKRKLDLKNIDFFPV